MIKFDITSKGKYSFTTDKELSGRGVSKVSEYEDGSKFYIVTENAFNKLEKEHDFKRNF